jgi:AcrR family transcriptional regulator
MEDWQELFLKTLANGSTVEGAARQAGVHRATAWRHRKTDKDFAELWDQALESGCDMLEEIALKRASQHSDMLLMFLLKARRPDKFMDRQRLEHVRVDLTGAQEELERMAKKILDEDEQTEEVKKLVHVDHKD